MKTYKEFVKQYIGSSDIASLILAGYVKEKGLDLKELHFGQDDSYSAYIVEGDDVEIGSHYSKVAEFNTWLKIYDDNELTKSFYADRIVVYRAAEMGCVIQLIHEK